MSSIFTQPTAGPAVSGPPGPTADLSVVPTVCRDVFRSATSSPTARKTLVTISLWSSCRGLNHSQPTPRTRRAGGQHECQARGQGFWLVERVLVAVRVGGGLRRRHVAGRRGVHPGDGDGDRDRARGRAVGRAGHGGRDLGVDAGALGRGGPPAPARCSRPTRRRVRSASSRPTGVHAASPAASAGASAGTVPAGYTQVGTVPTGAGTVAVAVDAATGAVYTAHHTGKSLSILVSTGDGGYLNAVTTPLSFAPAIVGGTPPEWCTPPSRPAAPRTPTAAPAAAPAAARAAGRQAVLQVGRRACVRRASPARAVPVVPARDRRAARFRPFCPVATAAITEVRSAPVNFSPS